MVAVGQIFYPLSICLENVSYSNEILLIVFHSCNQQILIPVTEKCHSCDRKCHSFDRKCHSCDRNCYSRDRNCHSCDRDLFQLKQSVHIVLITLFLKPMFYLYLLFLSSTEIRLQCIG